MRADATYLGDGVYASFDGYQVWLQTLEGHLIAVEPDVLQALVNFAAGKMPPVTVRAIEP